MKLLYQILGVFVAFLGLVLVGSCSDDEIAASQEGYGYMQLQLHKKGADSRALDSGKELSYLKDVRKIQITLASAGNQSFSMALMPKSVSEEGAEFGLSTVPVQLMPGTYKITYFVVYGDEVVDGQAEILQSGTPDEEVNFRVENNRLTEVDFALEAVLYGKYAAVFGKDLSAIESPLSRATVDNSEIKYDDIASAVFTFKYSSNGVSYVESYPVKAKKEKKAQLFSTDTIQMKQGDYVLSHYKLYNKNQELIYAMDEEQNVKIEHFKLLRDTVDVKLYETAAIRDYIALYNIWKAMGGEEWSWNGEGYNIGSNWVFKFADGTPRPIDMWGDQPGVGLGGNGRVTSLNLGSFNPKGFVPDAIGDLTQLETLYLGNHDETVSIVGDEGMEGILSHYLLAREGVDVRAHRMDIARERFALRRAQLQVASKLNYESRNARPTVYTKYAGRNKGSMSNRITGISERIGELAGTLTMLYIANGFIEELPESFGKLENLTDLEIYNCRMTTFPEQLKELPNLVSLNFSMNGSLDLESTYKNLDDFFTNGKSQGTVQLLYLNDNKLTKLPPSIRNMKKLGMLDLAYNKLVELPALGNVSPVQFMVDCNELGNEDLGAGATPIPNNFCITDDLELFSASCNKLKKFPVLLSNMKNDGKYSIEEIDLSVNQIDGFEPGFKGVRAEKLNLCSNKFAKLPTEFSEYSSVINFLRLSYNEITEVPFESFKNLKALEALELAGNKIKSMPNEFNSEYLPHFSGIDLSQNRFDAFPVNILYVNSLNQLILNSQGYYTDAAQKKFKRTLVEWPTGLDQHMALKILEVSGNDLRMIQTFPDNLNKFDVSDNPNIKMTVPSAIIARINDGSFLLVYDETQDITNVNN